MKNHRPMIPGMAHVPILGQQPSRQDAAVARITQQIEGLSLNLYAKLAADHIGNLEHSHLDVEKLKGFARNSVVAAKAYFEGLGIIEPE